MQKEINICSTCRFGVRNYTSVIGNIPWCCEKHWHCKPGSLASDYMPKHEPGEMLIAALRPISREQVEKVWRGEWKENKNAAIESAICSKCKTVFQAYYGNYQFCPRCGAPMTDEAVEMVMERMEALKDEA